MIRRAAIAATMLILLSTASVSAATRTIQVFDFGFSPTPTKVKLGTSVNWHNGSATNTHTSSEDVWGLWSEGISPGTTSASIAFRQSGTWTYHCFIHVQMHGTIKVRMKANPTKGTLNTNFVIQFATINAPNGFIYDVLRRKHGGTFNPWVSTTAQTLTFSPTSTGTWEFRSRLRRTSDNSGIEFSPILSVKVLAST